MKWNGQAVARLMDEAGLSNLRVADELGVHPDTVSNWIAGSQPRANVLMALIDLLGCEMRDLFAEEVTT